MGSGDARYDAPTGEPAGTTPDVADRRTGPLPARAIVEAFPGFAWVVDARLRLVASNAALVDYFARQFGTQLAPGASSSNVLPPDRAERFDEFFRRALARGAFKEEWRLADGRTFEIAFNPVIDDGVVAGVAAFAQDISARVQAEQALRRSEAKFRAVVENSHDGILFGDASARITYRSPSYGHINGFADEERVGHSGFETVHPEDAGALGASWADIVTRPGATTTVEYRIRHKDGSWRRVETTIQNLLENPSVGEMVVATRDITERKRLEADRDRLQEGLFQAQKLEAIGTLAGGVAHDFNNILAGLLGGLDQLELEMGIPPAAIDEIRKLKALISRGAGVAGQLLGFARRGDYEVKPVDVVEAIRSVGDMFARTRRDLVIVYDFGEALPFALVDPTQLHQVVLNLLLNAGHAMPKGGQLTVGAHAIELTPTESEPYGAAPGAYVRLVVQDTGVGIDDASLPHIFEPFFTTRGPGEGTGLGLASVYGIVRNHGGLVRVESKVGAGTTFTVFLPATTDFPTTVEPPARTAAPVARGTALVVDDEEELHVAYRWMLGRLGYDVMAATSGAKALDLLRENPGRVCVVVLDMTMPGMSGQETFEAIRATAPDVPVMLVSGFAEEASTRDILGKTRTAFAQKPFDFRTFAAKLAELR